MYGWMDLKASYSTQPKGMNSSFLFLLNLTETKLIECPTIPLVLLPLGLFSVNTKKLDRRSSMEPCGSFYIESGSNWVGRNYEHHSNQRAL